MYTLEERDGALYAKQTTINEWVPRYDVNWYLLTTSYRNFVSWFASPEAAHEMLGQEIHATVNNPAVTFRNHLGWLFHRADASDKPAYQEFTAIPEPKVKGHCKLTWHKGAWHKETVKGLVKVA